MGKRRIGGWLLAMVLACAMGTAGADFRPLAIDFSAGAPLQPVSDKTTHNYQDPTIQVEYSRVESPKDEFDVIYYCAKIKIQDPSQLRTASPDNTFVSGARAPAQAMARRVNAVLAINGDYCATFTGNKANNYVLRQGTVFRETAEETLDILLIDEDGNFHVLPASEDNLDMDKTQVDGKKVINAFQFGPALVIDGEKVADELLMDPSHSPSAAEPESSWPQRMCIAQIGDLEYMALCCRNGLNLCELRDLAMSLADCRVVYTLDGGNSTQMVFLGNKINNVNGNDDPRPLTDIIYFASAWFTEE